MSDVEEGKVAGACRQDEMENTVELIDQVEDDEGENQPETDDDATCEVMSTHSSLDKDIDSDIDLSDGLDLVNREQISNKPGPWGASSCLPKQVCLTLTLFKQSPGNRVIPTMSGDQGEKEDTEDHTSELLSQHTTLDNVSSNSNADLFDGMDDDDSILKRLKEDEAKKPPKDVRHPNKKESFKCPKCQRNFTERKKLTRHLHKCEIVPAFPCLHCDFRTISKRHLEAHLTKKHNVHRSQLPGSDYYQTAYPFKCDECLATYKYSRSLRRHIQFECGVSPAFTCPLCDHQTYQKQNLRRHLINVHKVERSNLPSYEVVPIFKCALCPFRAQLKTDLQVHVRAEHHDN